MTGWSTSTTEPTDGGVVEGHVVMTADDVRHAVGDQSKVAGYLAIAAGLWVVLGLVLVTQTELNVGVVLFPVSFLLFMWVLFSYSYRAAAARVLANKTEDERNVTFRFDASGFTVETPVSTSSGRWEGIHRVKEGETAFLIYPASNVMQVVPKRAFDTNDLPRLTALFQAHVRERAAPPEAKRTLILWVFLLLAFYEIWQMMSEG